MKCYVGIDLGSTTTKAVVLDEDGKVLGRGITNSRSNYDVACGVARNEAFLDARFNLFEEALSARAEIGEEREALTEALRRAFRREQFLHQLAELEDACRTHAEELARRHPEAASRELDDALDAIFRDLRAETELAFRKGHRARSDFFRDLAGSAYMASAQRQAKLSGLDYELLLGIYDKSILAVEAHVPETHLQEIVGRALARAAEEVGLGEKVRARVEEDVRGVVELSLTEAVGVGTGYGRARLPFPKECIRSEILCHGLGAHTAFPGTRTVLDIGGQDTKAIQVDENGIVTSFQMNDRCAAGCGRYLGYIADEMNLGLHELGPLAMQGTRPVRINSTCTVFAGAELRDRLATGQRREDILAGLHRAIMLRAMSLLARSGGIFREFTFTGGVAKNEAAVTALRQLVEEAYGIDQINISPDSIYTGAHGAAIFALRQGRGEQDPVPAAAAGGGAA